MAVTEQLKHHLAHIAITLNGSKAPQDLLDDLFDCQVENSIHLPDMCVFRLHDEEFKWLDHDHLKEGTKVKIEGGTDQDLHTIFEGEIVGHEMDMSAHGTSTTLFRCFDKSHRLHRGRICKTFKQVTDTDIVKKIGQEAGFTVKADATSVVHDWVIQKNQTNWEFLMQRAAKNGFRLYCKDGDKLIFEKIKDKTPETIELEWGEALRSFRPNTSAANQVDHVVVRGWDPKTKSTIIGESKSSDASPLVGKGKGPENAKKAFGSARHTIFDRPIHTIKEAEELAKSIHDEIAASYLKAEGLALGVPNMKPNMMLKIKNIGQKFSGEYHISSTTHTYTSAEGFSTQFTVSGKKPASLSGGGGSNVNENMAAPSGEVNVVVGIVTDNKDPESLGRVQVKYPAVSDDDTSFWARQCSQMAGAGRGFFNIPEINDEVLIAFEHGDMTRPFILGQLWNGTDPMPKLNGKPMHESGNKVARRGYFTRIGHEFSFDDTDGKGNITLKTANLNELVLDDEGQNIIIVTTNDHKMVFDDAQKNILLESTGKHKILLDDQGKAINVKSTAGHQINIDDMQNTITVKTAAGQQIMMTDMGGVIEIKDVAGDKVMMSNGIISVEAQMMLNLKAPVINVSGQMAVNISGLTITSSADAVQSISGAIVNISGQGLINETAPIIKLN